MNSIQEIVSDAQITEAFKNTNFGSQSHREVLAETLLKCAGGFYTGHTAKAIAIELGLVNRVKWKLTKAGGRYLFYAYEKRL